MENILTLYISWDPKPEMFSFSIPFLNRPILWYGFFFALGFFWGYAIFYKLLKKNLNPYAFSKDALSKLAEQISLYIVLATVIGARLGEFLFYQKWSDSVQDPLGILKFWKGGLASHGAILAIFSALFIFCRKMSKKYPMITWLKLLDLLVLPSCVAAGFIRIGNFFNQEILGTITNVPWAVIFGHPADASLPIPRHPVQIYESLFYFFLFFFFTSIKKYPWIQKTGKLSGMFFLIAFSFRFLIEFFKMHQSDLLNISSVLDMGQILSVPLIFFGLFLLLRKEKKIGSLSIEGN